MFDVDDLKIYRGSDIRITDKITVIQPTIDQIIEFGEKQFYSMLNIFVFEKDTLRVLNISEITRFNISAMREEIDEKICEFSPKKVIFDLDN